MKQIMNICDKTSYENYDKAQDAIFHVSRKQKKGMKSYKCDQCGNFHIATIRNNKGMKIGNHKKYPLQISDIKIPKRGKEKPSKTHKKQKQISIETTYKPFEYIKANLKIQ